MVLLKDVRKDYQGTAVLKGLDLAIPSGSIFGYIGPNGAGKTTTIRIMTGLMSDFSGDVIIDGISVRGQDMEIKSRIGYLPQIASFQDWRTLEQTLLTFGRLSGMSEPDLKVRIDEVLQDLDIEKYRRMRVSKLSGGTLQKAGMAQAILHRPRLLILDEPMSALDPESRVLFKRLFRRLSSEGTTIFFSSHILNDIQDVADTIGILRNGRLAYCGSMDGFRAKMDKGRSISVEVECPAESWQSLDELEGVSYVELVSEHSLLVQLEDDADQDRVSNHIIRHLVENDCMVRSVQKSNQGLEELYIAYANGGGQQ